VSQNQAPIFEAQREFQDIARFLTCVAQVLRASADESSRGAIVELSPIPGIRAYTAVKADQSTFSSPRFWILTRLRGPATARAPAGAEKPPAPKTSRATTFRLRAAPERPQATRQKAASASLPDSGRIDLERIDSRRVGARRNAVIALTSSA
jgi:hypothetical protein